MIVRSWWARYRAYLRAEQAADELAERLNATADVDIARLQAEPCHCLHLPTYPIDPTE